MPKYIPSLGMTNPMTTQGDLISGGPGGEPKRLAPGTSGQFLKTQGAGADPVWGDIALATLECIPSDNIRHSNDAAKYVGFGGSWVKAKEIKLNEDLESVRIKFSIKSRVSGYYIGGRIYKNGVAIGTLRQTSSTTYVEFSQDFSGFVSGDLIQLYVGPGVTSPPASDGDCAYFRLCFDRNVVKISNRTLASKLALNPFEVAPTNTLT
jgi:hypothetical protein